MEDKGDSNMRRMIPLCILSLLLITPSSANAVAWAGVQSLMTIGAEHQFTDTVGLRGSAHYFWVPQDNLFQLFTYVGPTFSPTSWYFNSPQIGTVSGWTEDGKDAFLVSDWMSFSFQDDRITLFVEGDLYLAEELTDYYGYYAADLHVEAANFGIQLEQVNTDLIYGPHIGIKVGLFYGEVQYYQMPINGGMNSTVRFLLSTTFTHE